MHQRALRTVLLIQAIEETDRTGEVIPLADRAEASRAIVRDSAPLPFTGGQGSLSAQSESFLVRRAERLRERLQVRSPAIVHILALAGGATWLGRLLLILAFVTGISLAELDGSRRINILAFPLIGLILWNLFIYALLLVAWLRSRAERPGVSFWSATVYERWITSRIEALLRQYTRFNVPLTTGLRRFAGDWAGISQPLLMLRAKRLLHLAAALLALGLIIGLYIRGIALRYEAGWESTFLGPESAHALIAAVYAPAAAISNIALPSSDQLRALRWTAAGGGGDAAAWIHLIALTAMLYIVIPRLLAALGASLGLWRLSRRPPLPASLLGYTRALVMGVGDGSVRDIAGVTPYGYEPGPESISGLESLLATALGANLSVQMREPIRYGDEESVAGRFSGSSGATATAQSKNGTAQKSVAATGYAADWNVLLLSLAATPEVENHGALVSGLRDWLTQNAGRSPLLVLVDEAPYAARMRGDTGFEQRVQERRKLWQDFVAGYGLRACCVDLSRMRAGTESEPEARDTVRAALWTASERA
jgi:hypothetical protein